ncbi:MAG: PAS domain-containing protein [Anaerolineaceae bacterium]|nr:PAS domain-containing protein [Anaerolineaceae bacterium]
MTNDPQELGGVLSRINGLGTAAAEMFNRLYSGISRKQKEAEREQATKVQQQNIRLRRALKYRNTEIERLQGILATIDQGVIMQDTEGRIVLVNKAARDLLGSNKAFWESELSSLFNAYRDITTVESELAPLGEPTRIQVNNRVIGAQVAAVADSEGSRLGTLFVLRDVTLDALSDRLKDQFVTAISHELRTPMAVIKGMSDVLLGQPAELPANRRFLETLSRNVDILDRMIVELLDISEMSANAFNIRHDTLQIEELIWNVVNGNMPEIKRANLDIVVMVRDLDYLQISGDDQRLRWAIGHLLQNAVRYNEPGEHIIITASLTDNTHVTIQVVDTGVGIAQKDLPHIFDRFYRGEPRTKGGKLLDPRGLGQGLFVARSVAEAHGGYLSVRSEAGHGSVFTMVLPLDGAPE